MPIDLGGGPATMMHLDADERLGVEVINPVQVSVEDMDPERLKREFGRDLSFWGGVDTQRVLPYGRPEDVTAEVRRRIGDLGRGGGYVLASVHNIQAQVPPENIVAMYDTASPPRGPPGRGARPAPRRHRHRRPRGRLAKLAGHGPDRRRPSGPVRSRVPAASYARVGAPSDRAVSGSRGRHEHERPGTDAGSHPRRADRRAAMGAPDGPVGDRPALPGDDAICVPGQGHRGDRRRAGRRLPRGARRLRDDGDRRPSARGPHVPRLRYREPPRPPVSR